MSVSLDFVKLPYKSLKNNHSSVENEQNPINMINDFELIERTTSTVFSGIPERRCKQNNHD